MFVFPFKCMRACACVFIHAVWVCISVSVACISCHVFVSLSLCCVCVGVYVCTCVITCNVYACVSVCMLVFKGRETTFAIQETIKRKAIEPKYKPKPDTNLSAAFLVLFRVFGKNDALCILAQRSFLRYSICTCVQNRRQRAIAKDFFSRPAETTDRTNVETNVGTIERSIKTMLP